MNELGNVTQCAERILSKFAKERIDETLAGLKPMLQGFRISFK